MKTVFDENGRSRWILGEKADSVAPEGWSVHDGKFGDDMYFNGTSVVPRPTNPTILDKTSITANGIDEATLSNIPAGAAVSILGAGTRERFVVNDGSLVITVDTEGEYIVTVNSFPEVQAEFTINAS